MLRHSRVRTVISALLAASMAVALASGCKKADPLEYAIRLLRKGKTDEAIVALTKLHEADPQAFDPVWLLAEATERKKDWAAAVRWYEKALALPDGQKLKSNFVGPLHEALMKLANHNSAFPDKYEEALLRAAAFERDMGMADTPANEELFQLFVRRYENAREAGRFDDAIAMAHQIGDLHYDQSKLRVYTRAIPRLEREKFLAGVRHAFETTVKRKLIAAGAYDAENNAIVVASDFTVPEKTEEGLFDPESQTFMQEVHFAACSGVNRQLAEVLNDWAKASPLGAELRAGHLRYFVAQAMEGQPPGWSPPLDPESPPESVVGLVYACSGRLSVDLVVNAFLKIKRALEKEAREADAGASGGGDAGASGGGDAGASGGGAEPKPTAPAPAAPAPAAAEEGAP